MSEQAQYDFWRRRLAGEVVPIYDGEPQAGFYRLKQRDGSGFVAVAYWYRPDGTLRCRIGTEDMTDNVAMDRWPWASKAPITHEVYQAVMAGGPWPDLNEAVTRSNNAPPDNSLEGLRDAIEDLAREAATLIAAGTAKDQDAADRASDLANRLGEFWKQADEVRKAEKRPHDEAAAAVQQRWAPVLTAAEIFKRVKAIVIAPFLTAKTDADRAARDAAARAGTPVVEPQRSTTKAGTRGRSVALREIRTAKIVDYPKAIAFFENSAELRAIVQKLANAAARAGVTPDGCEVEKQQVAA